MIAMLVWMARMPVDETDRPTPATMSACACPVDWEALEGFSENSNDALDALNSEWIRCFAKHAISREDVWLIRSLTLRPELYTPSSDEDAITTNILARRHLAVGEYMSAIGRLSRLTFLRPSEHGKHYSVTGPKLDVGKISYFYRDAERETLARLFWDWFNDIFTLESETHQDERDEPVFFADVRGLWNQLRVGRKLRIAIDTTVIVGEMGGQPLKHLALDLDLETGTGHAYPITEKEAREIMGNGELRPIKPAETLRL